MNELNNFKDCKACTDFKDWMNIKKTQQLDVKTPVANVSSNECPLYREELGRASWSLLHTMAAYYPKQPDKNSQEKMRQFIEGFALFFPCEECAHDFREEILKNPPNVSTRYDLSMWFCEQHNIVNRKLEKPEFDCSKVFERWKHGWKDEENMH